MKNDDMALVRAYARNSSEEAFATLVSRHINLVYSVALRQLHDAPLAEEVTQVVFIILARKAASLGPKTILSGWLCRTARYTSANALTAQRRRQHREQQAHMQSILNPTEPDAWTHIAPFLDDALAQLSAKDHDAIVLRFFEGKNMQEVGASLGTNEVSARKRVSRAVEKMRAFFAKRGVSLSAAVIAGAVSAQSIQAAPVGLAVTVAATALKATTCTGSTLTLLKGTLKLMAWAKAKTAIVAGTVALLAAGTATLLVHAVEPPPSVDHTKDSDSSEPTFEALLEHPAMIEQATWEWGAGYSTPELAFMRSNTLIGGRTRRGEQGGQITEMTPAGASVAFMTNAFVKLLKWDGTNYIVFNKVEQDEAPRGRITNGVYWGKFNGIYWKGAVFPTRRAGEGIGGGAIAASVIDPKINPPGFRQAELAAGLTIIKEGVNFGFPAMVPGSLVWDRKNHRLSASLRQYWDRVSRKVVTDSGNGMITNIVEKPAEEADGTMTAELTYEDQLPVIAVVHETYEDGFINYTNTVTYKYSPDFHHGRLPIEYAVSRGDTVRYHELILASGPIPMAQFDPLIALKGQVLEIDGKWSGQLVWSNGLPYVNDSALGLISQQDSRAISMVSIGQEMTEENVALFEKWKAAAAAQEKAARLAKARPTAVVVGIAVLLCLFAAASYWFYRFRTAKPPSRGNG